MKIVFAGNNLRAIKCLNYLIKKKINVILAIGHPKKKTDSKYYSSIKNISKKEKLNYINPSSLNNNSILNKLDKIKPDLMILVGYSACILKKEIYNIPKYGTINLHASLLPRYRGGSPLNWVIINGEKYTGISIIKVNKGIDTGKILAQQKILIRKRENILTLTKKVNKLYPKLLYQTIQKISSGRIHYIKQSKKLKYFSKRKPEDGLINFQKFSAIKIERLVRALLPPFPGAYFVYKKLKFIIVNANIIKNKKKIEPGLIVSKSKNAIIISTKDNQIKLKLINSDGKKANIGIFKINEKIL